MCQHPYQIKNLNYGLANKGYTYLKDTEHEYINVPCGHCSECIAVKSMYLCQRMLMESKKNHLFMCTLTYQDKYLPSIDVNGHTFKYADMRDFRLMVKRIRKAGLFPRPFRYLAVSERGSKKSRPHFHIIWLLPKYSNDTLMDCYSLQRQLWRIVLDNWQRNIGSHKKPHYVNLCEYKERFVRGEWKRNFDLQYVNPSESQDGVSNVAFYVLKYCLKSFIGSKNEKLRSALKLNCSKEKYSEVWNLIRDKYVTSRDFGLADDEDIQSYIKHCIQNSDKTLGYPQFFSPVDGKRFPLSPIYKKNESIFTLFDAHDFYFNYKDEPLKVLRNESKYQKDSAHFSKLVSQFEELGNKFLFNSHDFSDEDSLDQVSISLSNSDTYNDFQNSNDF